MSARSISASTSDAPRRYPTLPVMRLIVVSSVVLIGMSGLAWVYSGQISDSLHWLIVAVSVSTVPAAALIYFRNAEVRYPNLFIVYSDITLCIVIFASESPFDALPAVALLVLVTMFAAVYSTTTVQGIQYAITVAVTAVLAALSVGDGVDPLLVTARSCVMLCIAGLPLLATMHVRHLVESLEHSHRDAVSGLLNRRGLDRAFADTIRPDSSFVLGAALVQLRDFDRIERRLGSTTGKELVAEVTQLLRKGFPDAVLARIQPNEFACVVTGSEHTVQRELAFVTDLVENVRLRSATVNVKCATSVVNVGKHTATAVALGRVLTTAAFDQYGIERPDTATYEHITDLVAAGGPNIVFQQVNCVATGNILGYEALSRFPAGHGSTQAWFLDAVAGGVQVQLEVSALQQAVRAAATLQHDAFLSVNVSAATVLATDLAHVLRPASSFRPVVIEITEHDLVTDYLALSAALDDLRESGLSISVDDVGAGYSGLRQLVEIKPDVIKLDASIVRGIDTDTMRRAAADALTTFASAIGAKCIYEGIETQQEFDTARSLGADMVQGFLFGLPEAAPARSA
ncbi:MAG: EAL domain-containing protein [Rhodococcus sp. (in: high G+C Gram-positive bacteria)]